MNALYSSPDRSVKDRPSLAPLTPSEYVCETCSLPVQAPIVITGKNLCICHSCLAVKHDRYHQTRTASSALVYSSITQGKPSFCRDNKERISSKTLLSSSPEAVGLAVYPNSIKIIRNFTSANKNQTESTRGEIRSFSQKSRARLRFQASNAFPKLISQFCLTFQNNEEANNTPLDGIETKKLLNSFLTSLRDNYPGVSYLWILEFQTSGVPHFHLFLSLPRDTPNLHDYLATSWNRKTKGSSTHLAFHQHSTNFIKWDMGGGSYLTKYLDKTAQKSVPESFNNVGRFWGNSIGLVPPPQILDEQSFLELNHEIPDKLQKENTSIHALKFIVRALCRLHEKRLSKWGFKSRSRKTPTSYMLHNVAPIFWQMFNSFQLQAFKFKFAEAPF